MSANRESLLGTSKHLDETEALELAAQHLCNGDEGRERFWQAVQQSILERLGHERYSIWFRQTELMQAEDDELVVGVPNVIIQQYLAERYTKPVCEAVEDLVGRPVEVRFDVAPSLFRQMRAEQKQHELAEQSKAAPRQAHQNQDARRPEAPAAWDICNLIVTDANRLALAAAREVAGQQSPQFALVYVCGGYGSGKTALLRAAYSLASAPERGLQPIFMSTEDWCNDYYHAIQRKTTRAFRSRYRSCGMLLLDDLQFIEGKAGGQGELLYTVKHLLGKGGRVVLAGKPRPEDLNDVDPALRALLGRSFPAFIGEPRAHEWLQIVEELARRRGMELSEESCRLVTEQLAPNFGRAQSAIACLALYAGVNGLRRVELGDAREALKRMKLSGTQKAPPGMTDILQAVAEVLDLAEEKVTGRSRTQMVVRARHVAMYLARQLTDSSLTEIGRFFGGTSHSTVKHAVDKIGGLLDTDPHVSASVREVREHLDCA